MTIRTIIIVLFVGLLAGCGGTTKQYVVTSVMPTDEGLKVRRCKLKMSTTLSLVVAFVVGIGSVDPELTECRVEVVEPEEEPADEE